MPLFYPYTRANNAIQHQDAPQSHDSGTGWDDKLETSPEDEVDDSPWYKSGEDIYYSNYDWWSDLSFTNNSRRGRYLAGSEDDEDSADREEWKDEPNDFEWYGDNDGDDAEGEGDGDGDGDEADDVIERLDVAKGVVLFDASSEQEEE